MLESIARWYESLPFLTAVELAFLLPAFVFCVIVAVVGKYPPFAPAAHARFYSTTERVIFAVFGAISGAAIFATWILH